LLYPELVNAIQRACHRVHYTLGPGFLHQVYRRATMIELRRSGLDYDHIKKLPVEYGGHLLGYQDVRLIAVEGKVLLAAFVLRTSDDSKHKALAEQLEARLRRLGLELGLLANFFPSCQYRQFGSNRRHQRMWNGTTGRRRASWKRNSFYSQIAVVFPCQSRY
jgi:GxxExxY protein